MTLLFTFLSITGIVLSGFILSILLKRKNKQLPDKLLIAIFFFCFSLSASFFADLNELEWLGILFWLPTMFVGWIVGPLIYLYVKSLFEPPEKLIKKNKSHFIPAVVSFLTIVGLVFYIIHKSILLGESKQEELEQITENIENIVILISKIEILFYTTYAILSYFLLVKYEKITKSFYSNLSKKDVKWAKYMLIGIIIIGFVDIILIITDTNYIEITDDDNFGNIQVLNITLLIIYLGYYGINQSRVLLPDFAFDDTETPVKETENTTILINDTNSKEVTPSPIKEEEIDDLKDKLEQLFDTEKPHLDEDLTLSKLADLIPTTNKKLSSLLNQHLATSFYDLINNKRVLEFQKKVNNSNYSNYTLLGIAHECGFKSKASFYRIFKKETGLSPSEYKKQAFEDVKKVN